MRQRLESSEPAFVRSEPSGAYETPIPLRAPLRVTFARWLVRCAVAASLALVGAFALTGAGAEAIRRLAAESPVLSLLYGHLSTVDASRVIGIVELVAALLLVLSPISAALCLVGSLLAVATLAVSLSLLATTPGTLMTVPGFPLPVPSLLGGFLLKDVFPFLAASWSLLDAARALGSTSRAT